MKPSIYFAIKVRLVVMLFVLVGLLSLSSCYRFRSSDRLAEIKSDDIIGTWKGDRLVQNSYIKFLDDSTFIAGNVYGVSQKIGKDSLINEYGEKMVFTQKTSDAIIGKWYMNCKDGVTYVYLSLPDNPKPIELILEEDKYLETTSGKWHLKSDIELCLYSDDEYLYDFFRKRE